MNASCVWAWEGLGAVFTGGEFPSLSGSGGEDGFRESCGWTRMARLQRKA